MSSSYRSTSSPRLTSLTRPSSGYPSAFGHTPSYRSYVAPGGSLNEDYNSSYNPSAFSGLGSGSSLARQMMDDMNLDRHFNITPLHGVSGLNGGSNNQSSSYSNSSYSKSVSSSSDNSRGGVPRVISEYDSTSNSRSSGSGVLPRSSYSHSTSSYNSEKPWLNRNNHYSYNI